MSNDCSLPLPNLWHINRSSFTSTTIINHPNSDIVFNGNSCLPIVTFFFFSGKSVAFLRSHMMKHFDFFTRFLHHPILQLLYALLLILPSIPVSLSEIKNTWIFDDYRSMILFESFGFSKNGRITISVTNVTWSSSQQSSTLFHPSSMGFFIAKIPSFRTIWNESQNTKGFCVLSSRHAKLIFKFVNLPADSSYTGSIEIDDPDEYNLAFGNCQPEFKVSMHVHTEMYNLKEGEMDFLPAGQTPLPKLYFLVFFIYAGFFLIWVFACINQRPRVEKIHLIMGALLLFKCLKMICASEDKMYVRKTGTPHGWIWPFTFSDSLKA